jgi:hypothetical protein
MMLGSRHVSFNNLHLPANLAVQQARRSCMPLHVSTGLDSWPIGNRGTAFLYAYRKRHFCVLTRHQLAKDFHPSQVFIRLTNSEHSLYSGVRFIEFPKSAFGPEEFDLCAIEMPWNLRTQIGCPTFFKARPLTPLVADGSERHFTIGFPSRLTKLTGEECSKGIALSQVIVWADGLTQNRNDLPMLKLVPGLVMGPKCEGDFDGFSGGPVFGINARSRTIEFRGIALRGGGNKLFFATTDWVHKLCDIGLQLPQIDMVAA